MHKKNLHNNSASVFLAQKLAQELCKCVSCTKTCTRIMQVCFLHKKTTFTRIMQVFFLHKNLHKNSASFSCTRKQLAQELCKCVSCTKKLAKEFCKFFLCKSCRFLLFYFILLQTGEPLNAHYLKLDLKLICVFSVLAVPTCPPAPPTPRSTALYKSRINIIIF